MHQEGAVKTRGNPYPSSIVTTAWPPVPRTIMFNMLSLLVRSIRPQQAEAPVSPAAALLESAEARVGFDPHHAQELREAASAWLRVVR